MCWNCTKARKERPRVHIWKEYEKKTDLSVTGFLHRILHPIHLIYLINLDLAHISLFSHWIYLDAKQKLYLAFINCDFLLMELWVGLWFLNMHHPEVSLALGLKKKKKMEPCFSGLAFSCLCSGIKQKCNQTKPKQWAYTKATTRHLCFTHPLSAACVEQEILSLFFFSLPVYGCDCLSASACAFERMSRQERGEIDEGGKQEQCSTNTGLVVGWKMPEGFIRLEGRGHEQFCWKSIRPKHKHRRAPNPDLTLQSLLPVFCIFLLFPPFPHSYPPIFAHTISL